MQPLLHQFEIATSVLSLDLQSEHPALLIGLNEPQHLGLVSDAPRPVGDVQCCAPCCFLDLYLKNTHEVKCMAVVVKS